MSKIIVAAGVAIIALSTVAANAQPRRGGGGAEPPIQAQGRGIITWNTPYPNGNMSQPSPQGAGSP